MASSSSAVQQGPRKVVLVVGIQSYEEMNELKVTLNDAKLVAATLKNLGFLVTLKLDLTNRELRIALSDFNEEVVEEQDLVYFYFAGHAGQQWSKKDLDNFLFGKDAKQDESGKIIGVSLKHYLLDAFYKECIYIIILDACRVNPQKNQSYGSRSSEKDVMEELTVEPQLTLVMPELPETKEYEVIFGCQPGKKVFEDPNHTHGYLARAFCDGLKSANRWDDVRQNMVKQVKQETGNRQIPVVSTGLTQTLYIQQLQQETDDTSSNISAPIQPVFQKKSAQLEIPSVATSSNSSTPTLPLVQKKQVLNLLQFCEQLKSEGSVEDAEVNVSDWSFYSSNDSYPLDLEFGKQLFSGQYIQIDLTTIEAQQIFLKNLTFIQHEVGNDKRCYIIFKIGSGQHLVVSNCSFNAIGFRVEGSLFRQNNSASLSDINVSNTNGHGLYFQSIHPVSLNRIQIKNCKGSGFHSIDVENVRVENAKISQCGYFGMDVSNTKNFFGQFIEVETCQLGGFSFDECKGELKNIKIRDCYNDIETNYSEIEQTDVRRL